MKRFLGLSLAIGTAILAASTAHADIKIGVAGPLTGPNAAVGEQFRQGAERAAAHINKAGGIGGEKVVLIYGDDASDPKQGVSVANRFAAEGVSFVIGHYNSGVSIPASEVYAENGILQITPGSTNPTYTERQLWNTFRVCGRDDQQGAVAARYMTDHFKGKKIAVLNDKTAYGVGIAQEVKKGLEAAQAKVAIDDSINVGEKDFSALVSKLKAAKIDVIYFGGLYTEAGLIVRQAADQGLKATLVAGDGITSAEYAQIAGEAALGTLMTFAPDPRIMPSAAKIVEEFRHDGFEPEAYTLYAYAALEIVKTGVEKAKSSEASAVAEQLHDGKPVKTILGNIAFDKKGDRRDEDYAIYVWKKDDAGKISYEMTRK
ncbi:branched-chain amino acid ABC transporter substrate-binding protein [Rhizobium leguminosarum]|uniref:branched-chain amino acid ABC transporter substrate-binding protein n=1 Tax=Rhizobium TaxID=379 RepID=UPI001031ABBA|nr:branched-chain amino acid ABC transporter substrate-binding protein [Rhizobium leguminosarum]TBF87433.1 branched-chain amino acid ABC transporter substrate-binding protein [Rhizobium leguminosarum]TBG07048.1 branched-chain amino acid ABC transporter substrate-binding protein [Rhizobium leguminosarum]TBG07802.1 branched-chain amino acid ABC transporter substrate-binding protein [Rhizobium leguminosarum]TBG30739.1 branched-chain amino acid ABC transporter substrate-binding protein [Rhizobium l